MTVYTQIHEMPPYGKGNLRIEVPDPDDTRIVITTSVGGEKVGLSVCLDARADLIGRVRFAEKLVNDADWHESLVCAHLQVLAFWGVLNAYLGSPTYIHEIDTIFKPAHERPLDYLNLDAGTQNVESHHGFKFTVENGELGVLYAYYCTNTEQGLKECQDAVRDWGCSFKLVQVTGNVTPAKIKHK